MIGVYWGRFNPPHKGHLQLIKRILKEVDFLIIAIGSSKLKNTKRNPKVGSEWNAWTREYLRFKKKGIKRTNKEILKSCKDFYDKLEIKYSKSHKVTRDF